MKSQAGIFFLVLLLVAAVNEAECKVVKYKRSVKGKLVIGKLPGKKVKGQLNCDVTNYYDNPEGADGENLNLQTTLSVSKSFTTGSKGQISTSVSIVDNVPDSWVPTIFSVVCDISFKGKVVKSFSFGGSKSTDIGTVKL